jgi:hypothetical protein
MATIFSFRKGELFCFVSSLRLKYNYSDVHF